MVVEPPHISRERDNHGQYWDGEAGAEGQVREQSSEVAQRETIQHT